MVKGKNIPDLNYRESKFSFRTLAGISEASIWIAIDVDCEKGKYDAGGQPPTDGKKDVYVSFV